LKASNNPAPIIKQADETRMIDILSADRRAA
jgi:hypothetical protein